MTTHPAPQGDAIRFTLDGQSVEAAPGETIWQVAKRLGTRIPHLCYLDQPAYRPDGNCRACMVEVEGERVLSASCIRRPAEGMVVKTATERADSPGRCVSDRASAIASWIGDVPVASIEVRCPL